jgi:hypothetical protein
MMDQKWGSRDPNQYLPDLNFAAYDDHEYVKDVANLVQTKDAYLNYSCSDSRTGNWPVIVGEWSLSAPSSSSEQWTGEWNPSQNVDWYRQFWAAQLLAYEKVQGWVFFTWKTTGSLNDSRWDYQKAVALGIIAEDPDEAYTISVCPTSNATGFVAPSFNFVVLSFLVHTLLSLA